MLIFFLFIQMEIFMFHRMILVHIYHGNLQLTVLVKYSNMLFIWQLITNEEKRYLRVNWPSSGYTVVLSLRVLLLQKHLKTHISTSQRNRQLYSELLLKMKKGMLFLFCDLLRLSVLNKVFELIWFESD